MEDLERSPGQQISLAEISVVPEAETGLVAAISGPRLKHCAGWRRVSGDAPVAHARA
jgi:hypothetical protein